MNTPDENHIVLVVDDDEEFRLLVRSTLEQADYVVVEAESGATALKKFRSLKPNLVLSDVMMPNMDGFELCREIRQSPQGLNIPIVMVTGLDDVESIQKAYKQGATDFITKPVDWQLLTMRVNFLIRANQTILHTIQNMIGSTAQTDAAAGSLSPSIASLESQIGSDLLREMLSIMDESLQDVQTTEQEEEKEQKKPVIQSSKESSKGIDESNMLILRLQEMQAEMEFVNPYMQSVLRELDGMQNDILQAVHDNNMQNWIRGFLRLKAHCDYLGANEMSRQIQSLLFSKDLNWLDTLEDHSRRILSEVSHLKAYLQQELESDDELESDES